MPPRAPDWGANRENNPSRKRKDPPSSGNGRQINGNPRAQKRAKAQNARTILAQTSDAALSNGELDLQAFLKAREFEIKALEDGMRRSKNALTTRAFQEVPRELRRRTASHNVKRVPKRLQKRATREMKEDNTPTVKPSKRTPTTSRGRLRAETAKRLGLLAKKTSEGRKTAEGAKSMHDGDGIVGRTPVTKLQKNAENAPPKPPSKFRKRQIHKTWLPTHMFHAKRARMTEPKDPLWRMAIPITPNEKCYRPSHRAGNAKGTLCWDTSYMSTIGLEGIGSSIEGVLRGIGVTDDRLWSAPGSRWRDGKRTWSGWLNRSDAKPPKEIGPATVIWAQGSSTASDAGGVDEAEKPKKPPRQRILIRVHPSVFRLLFYELIRLGKLQHPQVTVTDLRFEIGSIELLGPGSTEALLGILHPSRNSEDSLDGHAKTFAALSGITNAATLPHNALLALSVTDPRLRFPPRRIELPTVEDDEAAFARLEQLAQWEADTSPTSSALWDRQSRIKASRLSSQKAVNRRKAASPPGEYPAILPSDSTIPIVLFTSRVKDSSTQGRWTLMAPWKCILPIWYCLMHYPLSSGSKPRFGGLQEMRQMHFEHGIPWYPGDYPGTEAGIEWEQEQTVKRQKAWSRRPKGKRTEFESLNLGKGRKGELGLGWSCDWGFLHETTTGMVGQPVVFSTDRAIYDEDRSLYRHLRSDTFTSLLANVDLPVPEAPYLTTVRITLLSRGVPKECARIYRLPAPTLPVPESSDTTGSTTLSADPGSQPPPTALPQPQPPLRHQWLALLPSASSNHLITSKQPRTTHKSLSKLPRADRHRALASDLLASPPLTYPPIPPAGDTNYPPVPGAEDLIGFVTTGNFNLSEGKGTAVGSLDVRKVLGGFEMDDGKRRTAIREDRICIVRNAGETVGRLAIWEVV
jgi:ribonuclease P/MRP protein subunit POP1